MATNSVQSSESAADALVASKIAPDAVRTQEIANGTITGTDVASETLTAGHLAMGSVGSSEIGSGAVGDEELFDGGSWNLTSPLTIQGARVNIPNLGADSVSVRGDAISLQSDLTAVNIIRAGDLRCNNCLNDTDLAPDAVGASELVSTGVGAGTYGGSTSVPQITVDQDGRVRSASNVAMTEGDPTVTAAWVKDGVSWAELKGQGMPAGFQDDVDHSGRKNDGSCYWQVTGFCNNCGEQSAACPSGYFMNGLRGTTTSTVITSIQCCRVE